MERVHLRSVKAPGRASPRRDELFLHRNASMASTRSSDVSRRQFLLSTAATIAVPYIIPRSVFGANERIVTGHVGVGRQGTANLKKFNELADPAALCDVDRDHLAVALKLLEGGKNPRNCDGYGDYRKV